MAQMYIPRMDQQHREIKTASLQPGNKIPTKTTRQSVSGTLPQDPSHEYGNFYTLFFLFK
jgi:hypothetical protein